MLCPLKQQEESKPFSSAGAVYGRATIHRHFRAVSKPDHCLRLAVLLVHAVQWPLSVGMPLATAATPACWPGESHGPGSWPAPRWESLFPSHPEYATPRRVLIQPLHTRAVPSFVWKIYIFFILNLLPSMQVQNILNVYYQNTSFEQQEMCNTDAGVRSSLKCCNKLHQNHFLFKGALFSSFFFGHTSPRSASQTGSARGTRAK